MAHDDAARTAAKLRVTAARRDAILSDESIVSVEERGRRAGSPEGVRGEEREDKSIKVGSGQVSQGGLQLSLLQRLEAPMPSPSSGGGVTAEPRCSEWPVASGAKKKFWRALVGQLAKRTGTEPTERLSAHRRPPICPRNHQKRGGQPNSQTLPKRPNPYRSRASLGTGWRDL